MALIAGDISALSKRQSYLHFDIPDPTPRKISTRLAYALYQAQIGESENREATALDPADFEVVVETLAAVQELDQQALRRIVITPDQYAPHLETISSVAKKTPQWRALIEAQAAVAIAARRYDEARKIYGKFLEIRDLPREDRTRYLEQMERLKVKDVEAPADVLPRRDISTLNADELNALRDAFKKLYKDNSNNGYKFIAAMYGRYRQLPDGIPNTKTQLMYLAWNRAYLAHFEAALRRVNPALSIPYWDVTQLSALPSAVRVTPDNPLAAGPLRLISADGKVLEERQTTREAGLVPADIAKSLGNTLSINVLWLFELQVWNYVGAVHVSVGGDMGLIENTAFDPLFWFLHANADRLWALWQAKHSNIEIADSVLDQKLEPFGKTVRDVLNTDKLGYKY